MLKAYQKSGMSMISIEDVLDLLGQDPAAPETAKARPRDPREDPLTGALWAGPPGSAPPALVDERGGSPVRRVLPARYTGYQRPHVQMIMSQ